MARLIKATNIRYGRFVDCSVRLDEKVIAIVGPNEAGKTTLLKSFVFASCEQPMNQRNRPRAIGEHEEACVELRYLLDADDMKHIQEEFNLCETPSKVSIVKHEDGRRDFIFNPEPRRQAELHESIRGLLDSDGLDEAALAQLGRVIGCYEDQGKITPSEFDHLLTQLDECGFGEERKEIECVLEMLDVRLYEDVGNAISDILPRCVLFDDDARSLRGEYEINDSVAANPPTALQNLLNLAGTSVVELNAAIRRGDDFAESVITKANRILGSRFADAWKQSAVKPKLKVSNARLLLYFQEAEGDITRFDSRSTGLQSYAALLAFIYANGLNEKTVLLIDEAESHLHVDAQVSLVDTFIQQTLVGKIIYTTHSPACLPPDIGNAIKAVVPNADDNFRSNVTGDLLSLSKGGVFPLSFAMGAMTAAMSAFRAAVIVEGPSDAILIPTLIKKVIGESNLLYRIVPGLAQTNPELYREYESMALHVIYVVDGDRDGVKYAEGLKECGVQKSRIIMLDEGMVLEDLVDRESYVNAYEQVVQDAASANRRSIPVQALDEDASFRIQAMKEWCEKNGVREPSKPAVAYKLIEDADNLVVSDAGVEVLRRIHNTVVSELG